MLPFWKYHGTGNDFVLFDVRSEPLPEDAAQWAVRVCHRRLGIGADGILLLGKSAQVGCDVAMQIINSDGSTAEMCGNGLRCLVKHVLDDQPESNELTVHTGAGALRCLVTRDPDGRVISVRESMGRPLLERAEIPMAGEGRPVKETITHPSGQTFLFTAVSMGNPHAVIFLDGGDPLEAARRFGPGLEPHPLFPRHANISFVRVEAGSAGALLRAAVYERGAGLTAACGTGACAIGVAAGLEERVTLGEPITVALPGGSLTVEVTPSLDTVWLTGPAVRVAQGRLDPDSLATAAACRHLTAALGG